MRSISRTISRNDGLPAPMMIDAQAGRRRQALHQNPLDLESGAHVRRQRAARLDPAEVHDPVHARAPAGRGEILGGDAIAGLEAAHAGLH